MTPSEYEQKKRECWEHVKFALRASNTDRKVFDFIFDQAYTIGSQWRDPKKELPKDGEVVLIREYFRSARHGRFVNHVREFMYFEQYGFKLEEDINKHLGYRITHWMPIPDVPNK